MIIRTTYDTTQDENFSMMNLLLNLDEEVDFMMPFGMPANGILKAVHPMEDGWVRLTFEVSDGWRPYIMAPYN